MSKIDLKKETGLYNAKKTPSFADVPCFRYLMIDGKGNPNTSQEYKDAVEALFSVAYTLKFMVKKGPLGIDYGVMPLEGLWWAEDFNDFIGNNKDNWLWTMMILQPEFITLDIYEEAKAKVGKKKELPALDRLRLEEYHEGWCGQILHVGPFSEEGPTIQTLHDFIKQNGCEITGKHHEIYLNDIRKVAPGKMKTIIRQPASKEL